MEQQQQDQETLEALSEAAADVGAEFPAIAQALAPEQAIEEHGQIVEPAEDEVQAQAAAVQAPAEGAEAPEAGRSHRGGFRERSGRDSHGSGWRTNQVL